MQPNPASSGHRVNPTHIRRVQVGARSSQVSAPLAQAPAPQVERAGSVYPLSTVLSGIAFAGAQGVQVLNARLLAGMVACAFKLPPATLQRYFGWPGEVVRSAACLCIGAATVAGVARPWVPRECGNAAVVPMVAGLGVAGAMYMLPGALASHGLGMKLALNALTRPVMATVTELCLRANMLGLKAQLVVHTDSEQEVARIPADRLVPALDKPRLLITTLLCLTIIWMHGQLGREYETGLLAQAPDDPASQGALEALMDEAQVELSATFVEGLFALAFVFAATWQALRNDMGLRLVEDVPRPLAAVDADPMNPIGPRIRARTVAGWLAGECSVLLAHVLGVSGHALTDAVQRAVYALCALHGYAGQLAAMAQVRREAPQQPAGTRDAVAMLAGGAGWELQAAPEEA